MSQPLLLPFMLHSLAAVNALGTKPYYVRQLHFFPPNSQLQENLNNLPEQFVKLMKMVRQTFLRITLTMLVNKAIRSWHSVLAEHPVTSFYIFFSKAMFHSGGKPFHVKEKAYAVTHTSIIQTFRKLTRLVWILCLFFWTRSFTLTEQYQFRQLVPYNPISCFPEIKEL